MTHAAVEQRRSGRRAAHARRTGERGVHALHEIVRYGDSRALRIVDRRCVQIVARYERRQLTANLIDMKKRIPFATRRSQRGAAGTLAAIWIIVAVAVAALGAIDVGNFFLARRSLQSVVDLAASAGSQVADSACTRS